jgi:aminomethyltransferase
VFVPGVAAMRFMDQGIFAWQGRDLWISRSGYTGEDGYEISVPVAQAEALATALLGLPGVRPIGLGARDSLRLEAGLCLYGHEMDEGVSPVEAALSWAIPKVRRSGGARAGGFAGAARILHELDHGPARIRVGLRPEGRAPMRDGTDIFAGNRHVGQVTSGGFGPSVGAPVAMALIAVDASAPGTPLSGEVRGKRLPVALSPMPFHPHSYKR